ncbi:hypothetical protein HHL28_07535 [Aerophototrophica crusticola]|uniref:Uncharacterized protein n=1 Tax=Aerophototrophica crusticola TaxID=1709002 RepID=A0A858R7E6_9PROT|nr:hypothetical protein HHL28_07535 [Rhodospirillaceae bacterium B3]
MGSLVLAVVLPALAVKAWTDGSLRGKSWDLLELSLRSLAWLATAAGLAGRRHLPTVLLWGSRALLVLAGLHVLVLQLLVQNPLWTGRMWVPGPC